MHNIHIYIKNTSQFYATKEKTFYNMEKTLFDQSPRSTLDIPLPRSNKSMNSYSSFSSSSSCYSPYSSGTSLSHPLYNYSAAATLNSMLPLCQNPPVPFAPSLSSSLSLPKPNQPPLLPLPLNKNSSFPSQINHKKFIAPTAPKRKPRAMKKEPRVQSKNVKIPLERKPSFSPAGYMTNDENNMDEENLITSQVKDRDILDCYSISPPPSSLPLPGLALLRPKLKRTTACNTEAVFEEAKLNNLSGVDNGATDNLRRILRL